MEPEIFHMPRRQKAVPAPPAAIFAGADHILIRKLDLTIVTYLYTEIVVEGDESFWVPRDMIGADGKTMIIYRRGGDGSYRFAGWEPWHDGMFGGRYETVSNALSWVQCARDVRAGIVADFRGV